MIIACRYPVAMWIRDGVTNPDGTKIVKHRMPEPLHGWTQVLRRCDSCIPCRVQRRMHWAMRLQHEAAFHAHSWFITLTYSDEHLPFGGSLCMDHVSAFMQILRQRLRRRGHSDPVRYFSVGEYGGERLGRPHYHLILFGPDFPDRKPVYSRPIDWKSSNEFGAMFGDARLQFYRSDLLDACWKFGLAELTATSSATMHYVTKYHVDKVVGDQAEDYYQRVLPDDRIVPLEPESARMSTKPGIGRRWIEKYFSDVYPQGELIAPGGQIIAAPPYYDSVFKERDPEGYARMKEARDCFDVRNFSDQRVAAKADNIEARVKFYSTLRRL